MYTIYISKDETNNYSYGVWIRAVTNNRFESIQVANRLINSKLLNQFTETINNFYPFNGSVARKCR